MARLSYRQFYKAPYWDLFTKKVYDRLQAESVLITGLPEAGHRFFLKYIQELFQKDKKRTDTLLVPFEIIPGKTSIDDLGKIIKQLILYQLKSPKHLEKLSCEEIIREVITRKNKKILFIINRLDHLQDLPESIIFLEALRAIDPLSINFLIGCDASCITNPEKYQPAGILTFANIFVLPRFNTEGIKTTLKTFKKAYNWEIPLKHAEFISELTAGLPGLLKYTAKYIHDHKRNSLNATDLYKEPGVNFRVKNIYDTLTKYNLLQNNKLNTQKKNLLYALGATDKKNKLQIELLKPLLSPKKETQKTPLEKILSVQEQKIYKFLESQEEQIVTLDEISDHLWGKDVPVKYSLWAMYKTISSLRQKLEKYDLTIKNYRGRGYSLTTL